VLEPDVNWRPNATQALQRFRARRRDAVLGRWRNSLCVLAASAFGVFVLADIPSACAKPRGCVQPVPMAAAVATPNGVPFKTISPAQFKVEGNPRATVAIELFSDYQCPECARFFQQMMPLLEAQYIVTGKIKFVHHDFPLPQHQYARLAARYVNAAGSIGKYEAATEALFRSQQQWTTNGDIATPLSKVLTREQMNFVQHEVDSDTHLDDTVTEDLALVAKDNINHTPALVIVSKSGRQPLPVNPPFEILKNYLDSLLAR
jgi:protein-disulfide isomerase